jgi:putative ABC transport system permease protein
MIVGVSSVVIVIGLSSAAATAIDSQLSSPSAPSLTISADPSQLDPLRANLSYRDALAVQDAYPGTIQRVVPNIFTQTTVSAGHASANLFVISTPGGEFGDSIVEGRDIDANDIEAAAPVCILSQSASNRLFADESPIGQAIKIGVGRLTVVGVRGNGRGSLFANLSGEYAVAPYSTLHRFFSNVYALNVWPRDGSADAASADALKALTHIKGSHARYLVQSTTSLLKSTRTIINLIAAGFSLLGSISLLVAGIGIMNIMLISVAERKREIGIRKAIGARSTSITFQFLIEAIVLALVGGGVGTAVGMVVLGLASAILTAQVGSAPVPYAMLICAAF